MAKLRHQGGAAAEVEDSLVEVLLATGEWEVDGAVKPAPVKRTRKVAPKPEEATTEE